MDDQSLQDGHAPKLVETTNRDTIAHFKLEVLQRQVCQGADVVKSAGTEMQSLQQAEGNLSPPILRHETSLMHLVRMELAGVQGSLVHITVIFQVDERRRSPASRSSQQHDPKHLALPNMQDQSPPQLPLLAIGLEGRRVVTSGLLPGSSASRASTRPWCCRAPR